MWIELEKVEPMLVEQGYKINNPWDYVRIFEEKVAKYAGSKYAIALDNCTDALFFSSRSSTALGAPSEIIKVISPLTMTKGGISEYKG